MDIRDKVQIDAIKDRAGYSICDYGTHVLIYNGTYGVYVPEEDMMLNPKRYEKNEDITSLNPYDVEDATRSATIIKESITFSGEIANAVIDYGREKNMDMAERDKEIWKKSYIWSGRCTYGRRRKKDSRGNGCRRKYNWDH